MIGREKCAERARIFIAYPGKIVNTILIYDSNIWYFLSFSPDISHFLKWQFHFSLEGFVYAEDFGTGAPLRGGLSHDRRRRRGGRGRVRRQGQPGDADRSGPAAGLLSHPLHRPRHHFRDRRPRHELRRRGGPVPAAGGALYPHPGAGIRHRVQPAEGEKPLLPVRQAAAGQPEHGPYGPGHPEDRPGPPLC